MFDGLTKDTTVAVPKPTTRLRHTKPVGRLYSLGPTDGNASNFALRIFINFQKNNIAIAVSEKVTCYYYRLPV